MSYIYQIKSRCFNDLNPTYKTLKLLEEPEYFYSLKQGKIIGRRPLQAEEMK